MKSNVNHTNDNTGPDREILETIPGARIAWGKTREEIWPELLAKIESGSSVKRNVRTVPMRVVWYAAAAIMALLIGIPSVMYLYTKSIDTRQAQQTEIVLPDHSVVKLFAQTTLSYKPLWWRFSRFVKLEGEGFFEVEKGEKFEVISHKGKTAVLGTRFGVYTRNNEYHVTCESGKVKVIEPVYQHEAIITGGQKAILKPDGTFEIIDKITTQPENITKTQNQAIEEELNTVLTTVPEQVESVDKKDRKDPAKSSPSMAKEPLAQPKPENPAKQEIKGEQNQVQNQSREAVPNQAQTKTADPAQAGNKVQEQNQGSAAQPVKDKFRASLSPEQISILENQQMSKEEKKKAFMQSLTPDQRQLLKEQNEERAQQAKANQNAGKESENIKDQQKSQVREQVRESSGQENKDQQQRQNRENKGSTPPGGGNNPSSDNSPGGNNRNQPGKGN